MSGFRTAVTFLTRLPIGDGEKPNVDAAPAWFPIVGLLIGAVTGLVFWGGAKVFGPLPAAALAVAVGALITGAFHQDGLADTADAFGGGWTVEQRLAIFKDSRHGTYGVMSLVLIVVLQVAALSDLLPWQGFFALVAAHGLGRCGAVALMLVLPPVRADGLGAGLADRTPRDLAIGSIIATVAIVAVAIRISSVLLIGSAFLATAAVGWLAHRKIGGIVGDVLGAAEQVVEAAVLLTAAALATQLGRWPF